MTKGFYKRGWHHTKTRGKESLVTCSFCGRQVPRYKTFPVARAFRINDPLLKRELQFSGSRPMSLGHSKMYACPGCARHRKIVRTKR